MVNRVCRFSTAKSPTPHWLLATVVVFRVFSGNFLMPRLAAPELDSQRVVRVAA
jgi:hypothetical protein